MMMEEEEKEEEEEEEGSRTTEPGLVLLDSLKMGIRAKLVGPGEPAIAP